jgi:hypothetical protein
MKTANQLSIFVLCLAVLTQPAYAYLDPGTGSLLLQGIIGGIAASITVLSLYYNRVKAAFSRLVNKSKEGASK